MTGGTLLTGGSGRLGSELRALMPELLAPTHAELDLGSADSVRDAVKRLKPSRVVHAAAYTDVAGAETDRAACWDLNVTGTRRLADACREVGARLVHVSTDYVFWGDVGGYREDDPPGPVRNYYALSKLAAEEVARTVPGSLVVRTSFRPKAWPYPKAFTDLYTSQDYVDVIAPMVAWLLRHLDAVRVPVLHVATERKSVYDLARRRSPDVKPASKAEAPVALPDDISLNVQRFASLRQAVAS